MVKFILPELTFHIKFHITPKRKPSKCVQELSVKQESPGCRLGNLLESGLDGYALSRRAMYNMYCAHQLNIWGPFHQS